ncbi:MAG: hypothetical protein U0Q15_10700 [Kineosporiaceae bacterium]
MRLRGRGWALLLLATAVGCLGTVIALGLVAVLLWVLPDDPTASGLSPNATAALLGVGAVGLLVVGGACLVVGLALWARGRRVG